jgi:hypothetical protein
LTVTASPSRSLGRLPTDPAARERLREAQAAEARVVATYYTTATRLDSARAMLAEAESELSDAVRAVVATSGAERATILLGIGKAELRHAITAARPQ